MLCLAFIWPCRHAGECRGPWQAQPLAEDTLTSPVSHIVVCQTVLDTDSCDALQG